MAGQRMTRDAFDAVVQKKMQRFRVSMDQAIHHTLREAGPSTTRRSLGDMESSRGKQRYSMHDRRGSLDRNWDMEMRRDVLNEERLYREELNAREEFLAHRSWEIDCAIRERELAAGRPEVFRDLREFGPVKDVFKFQGPMGQMPMKRRGKKGPITPHVQNFGEDDSNRKPTGMNDKNASVVTDFQILKWAKFNSKGEDLELTSYKGLFKQKTKTCKMTVECFKQSMKSFHREQCFNAVKQPIISWAMRSHRIDNELLDLLIARKTVKVKNDFFNAIKPFDKEMMVVQQRLLKCVTPLLFASNTFELEHSLLKDPRQVLTALQNTVSLCQKSIVLIGQTFAMVTASRQDNVLDVLGISESSVKPSDHPNLKNFFLFGSEFISELKDWLKNKDNKLTLKSTAKTADANVPAKEELKTNAECQERKAADPKAVAAIDKLLEDAKKGNQTAGEKSEFWFLFDEGSNEYKYYRQKFIEFQKSKGQMSTETEESKLFPTKLVCEAARAMLYAKKVQTVKRRLFRSLAFSRKRKQTKLKKHARKTSSVKMEEKINQKQERKDQKDKKQESEFMQTKETTTENSARELDVKPEKTPDKCSVSDGTDAQDEKLPEEKKLIGDIPPDVDEKSADTALKLAEFVAQMGPEIEQFSMENSANNPEFWFLCDKDSSAYKFYKSKVEEFKQANKEATSDEDIGLEDNESQNDSDGEMDVECEAAEAAEALSTESTPVAAFSKMPTPARPLIPRKRVANLKVGMLPAKRVCLVKEPEIHDPVRIEYERGRGRVNRKKKPVDLEFANKKLTQQNVGFKMLTKMGWQEGQGLGFQGSGIKDPIKVGTVSVGEGLGADDKADGNSGNFDAFRERMIKMYRQKLKNEILEDR